jgi:hypothetical protein
MHERFGLDDLHRGERSSRSLTIKNCRGAGRSVFGCLVVVTIASLAAAMSVPAAAIAAGSARAQQYPSATRSPRHLPGSKGKRPTSRREGKKVP